MRHLSLLPPLIEWRPVGAEWHGYIDADKRFVVDPVGKHWMQWEATSLGTRGQPSKRLWRETEGDGLDYSYRWDDVAAAKAACEAEANTQP